MTNESVEISLKNGGALVVEKLADPEIPGFYISYRRDDGSVFDLVAVEVDEGAGIYSPDEIRTFVWNDSYTDEYTHKFIASMELMNSID